MILPDGLHVSTRPRVPDVPAGISRLFTRPELLVALGIFMLAALVSLPHALHDALWQDEVASARILEQPTLLDVLHRVRQTESTPPLWYVLAWLSHRAGLAITEVRLLSVTFVSAAAALVVILARRVV